MKIAEIEHIFETLRLQVEDVLDCHFPVKCVIDHKKRYPKNRNYAMTSGDIVFLSPKIFKADENRVQALLRHELGHAVLMQAGLHDHTETQVDALAEALFGDRIYYDEEDIQTLALGKYPRPNHLPN